MTVKERALKNLKQMCSDGRYLGSGSYVPLEVLEDFEPIDYKAQYESFSKKAEIIISQLREDRDRLLEVFDKIRAEIESLERFEMRGEKTPLVNGDKALAIIDKYKTEREVEK